MKALLPLVDRPPAEPWRRIVARAIDAATVLTVLWVLVVVRALWFMPALTERLQPSPWERSFVPTVCFVVLAIVYEMIFLVANEGQTPGKDVMNLRVVRPTSDGGVTRRQALLRSLPALVVLVRPGWAAVGVVGVAALPMLLGRGRSALDVIAGTVGVDYDRDLEDPNARRPVARQDRRAAAREQSTTDTAARPMVGMERN